MKKILITEDNKTIADALAMSLEDEGYETLAVYDGLRGFLRSYTWQPDMIIMDVNLGASTGFEVAKEILDTKIPIMFITASTDPHIEEDASKFNTIGVFHKPFDCKYLIHKINQYFIQH